RRAKGRTVAHTGREDGRETCVELCGELAGGQIVDAPVQVAVRSHFMAGADDFVDEIGGPGSNPSKHEKRGADAAPIEEREQRPRVGDDAARQIVPGVARERRTGVTDVKPLLDIDGEAIAHAWTSQRIRRGPSSPRAALRCTARWAGRWQGRAGRSDPR